MAVALILSYIESLFSGFIPVPGVKIGLSNVVVVYILYEYGFLPALGFGISKSLLASFFTGRISSIIFSLFGIILSVCIMALIKKSNKFSLFGVNVSGAIIHIIGQITAASFVLGTPGVWTFLPWIALIAVASGIVTYLILISVFKVKNYNKNS